MIEIRHLARRDMIERAKAKGLLHRIGPRERFKGWSAWQDGRLVGVGALHFAGPLLWATVDIDPSLKGRATLLHRLALRSVAMAEAMGETLHVTRDPNEPTSERWLRRLGFRPTGEFYEDREIWVSL